MKIHTIATIPDALAREWVQHVRDFDTAHRECHMQIFVDAPQATIAEIETLLDSVYPPLPVRKVIKR